MSANFLQFPTFLPSISRSLMMLKYQESPSSKPLRMWTAPVERVGWSLWACCGDGGCWCSLEPLFRSRRGWTGSPAPPNTTPQSVKRQERLFVITWALFNRFPHLIFYFLPLILSVHRWLVDCDQRAVSSFFSPSDLPKGRFHRLKPSDLCQ